MDEKEKIFCEKLTEFLRQYGFGIADEPHTYELEQVDYSRQCSIDEEGRLQFV
ncbi:MAG: hypothetical protein ABR936_10315 [Bacteroidota bacterium]